MKQVLKAHCPGCRQVLRIPADWVGRSVCCKHCGATLSTRPKQRRPPSSTPPPAPAGEAGPFRLVATSAQDAKDGSVPEDPFAELGYDAGPPASEFAVHARGRRRRTFLLAACVAGSLTMLAAVFTAVAAFSLGRHLREVDAGSKEAVPPAALYFPPPAPEAVVAAAYPRRLLAVAVSNYLYASPVACGDGDLSVAGLVRRLAATLHLPDSQVLLLSDAGPDPRPPLRDVIRGTVETFLESSRPQDRVMLLFVGHTTVIGEAAFLIPVEGELDKQETLIPLRWLYDRLVACKARQKVLVLDVCRLDPSRGLERPGTGPMPARLDALLRQPPAGVQVWTSCVGGQYSYEADLLAAGGVSSRRGIFLGELGEAVGPFTQRGDLLRQGPGDPLPLAALAKGAEGRQGVGRRTEGQVAEAFKVRQSPRLAGEEPSGGAVFNAEEPLPPRLAIKLPPAPTGGAVPADLVEAVFRETGAETGREGESPLRAALLPAFSAKVMAPYRDDRVPPALREAIARAHRLLVKYGKTFEEEFRGREDNAAVKKRILAQQREPARALAELKDALEVLDAACKDLDRQPPRWQATAEYVRARLLARIAYVYEYDYMLGQIRKESLPARDPSKHAGWRLAARDKLQSGPEAKRYAKESRAALDKLARQRQGTPWEILAKRQAVTALGLEWQLIPR